MGVAQTEIALLDADSSNGNLARTLKLVELYTRLRDGLRGTAGRHEIGANSDFLHTNLRMIAHSQGAFGSGESLKKLFHRSSMQPEKPESGLAHLMDGLYNESEQSIPLNEGFRGRPSIGALLMAEQDITGQPFWDRIDQALTAAQKGDKVHIFFVGSVFGGTGAAGIPTFARLISSWAKRHELDRTRITIGAALMLPYFDFPPPPADQQNDVVARSETFLSQSQGALIHYNQLMGEKVFDQLYLLGFSPLIRVGNFSRGGPSQENPALIPELYSGLAACRFFGMRSQNQESVATPRVYALGQNERGKIDWDDLPSVNDRRGEAREKLGRLLRFCFAFKWVYGPYLGTNMAKKVASEYWFKRWLKGVGIDDPDVAFIVSDTLTYAESALEWISAMSLSGGSGDTDVNLVAVKSLISGRSENEPLFPIDLRANVPIRQWSRMFANLIAGIQSPDLTNVYEGLSYGEFDKDRRGVGRFIGNLFELCRCNVREINDDG